MTKKELFEMLSEVPDNASIAITHDVYNLISDSTCAVGIKGFYENNGIYVLSTINVRPYKVIESND